jgi:two-component system response regulator FixJ
VSDYISIIDDDDAVRESLKGLLAVAGYRVRCFSSAERFLEHSEAKRDRCAVIDIRLPGMDGLALQKELSSRGLNLRTIFMTGYATVPLAVEAMRLGASGFLPKPVEPERLLAEIEHCVKTTHARDTQNEDTRMYVQQLDQLTPREAEIASGIIQGLSTRQVAVALGISSRTAESHRANIMGKLRIGSVATLTRMACLTASQNSLPAFGEENRDPDDSSCA